MQIFQICKNIIRTIIKSTNNNYIGKFSKFEIKTNAYKSLNQVLLKSNTDTKELD